MTLISWSIFLLAGFFVINGLIKNNLNLKRFKAKNTVITGVTSIITGTLLLFYILNYISINSIPFIALIAVLFGIIVKYFYPKDL